MRCPRCEKTLSRYSLEESDAIAVVCESCGFAGVSASHHSQEQSPEPWDAAIERLDAGEVLEDSRQTYRGNSVSLPANEETGDARIDQERLEGTGVAVAAAITSLETEDGESAVDSADNPTPGDAEDGPISNGADDEASADVGADETTATDATEATDETKADSTE